MNTKEEQKVKEIMQHSHKQNRDLQDEIKPLIQAEIENADKKIKALQVYKIKMQTLLNKHETNANFYKDIVMNQTNNDSKNCNVVNGTQNGDVNFNFGKKK